MYPEATTLWHFANQFIIVINIIILSLHSHTPSHSYLEFVTMSYC